MHDQKRLRLASMVVAALAPSVAHADVVWPAVIVESRLLSIPVIVLGLLVEAAALRRWFGMSWARAGLIAAAVNAVSAALGILLIPLAGLAWEIFPGIVLYRALRMGTFSPLTWAATFMFAVLVTTAIEAACLRKMFKIPWDPRQRRIWLIANAVSVGLAFVSFAIAPIDTKQLYHPWLVGS